jgi:pimeloyl-ACP methyl ester carboxylesterase
MTPRTTELIDNGAGWQLALHRLGPPRPPSPGARPVVLVPGFAMNSFILGYHPNGPSFAGFLADAGLEVWAVELRGQGDSRRTDGARNFALEDLGLTDLGRCIEAVLERTQTGATEVDLVGCSLGATFMFIQAAWWPVPHVRRLVNVGGPLRWAHTPKLAKAFSALGPALKALPIKGTRRLARLGLPLAKRIPGLLHLYLHPATTDLSEPEQLTRTIDDPHPSLNAQIARWIKAADLCLGERNLTQSVARLHNPLLTVVANADGIVPEDTVCSAHNVMGEAPRQILRCGSPSRPMAHADLFIGEDAPTQVFAPVAAWLLAADPA